jgi:hypothetical protein
MRKLQIHGKESIKFKRIWVQTKIDRIRKKQKKQKNEKANLKEKIKAALTRRKDKFKRKDRDSLNKSTT